MKLLLFLAADYANVTGDGKLNVMGVFNDINATNFPARHASMYLVAKLGAELGEYGQNRNFSVVLLDQDGNQIMDVQGQLEIPKSQLGRKPDVNIILDLKDVIFPKPGPYTFVIMIDKDHKGELTLYANKIETQKSSQQE